MNLMGLLSDIWMPALTLSSLTFWSGFIHLWIWSEPLFQIGVSVKNQNRMANSVDPDEMAHYEPSHQDLHCKKNKKNKNVLVCRAEKVNLYHSLGYSADDKLTIFSHFSQKMTDISCKLSPYFKTSSAEFFTQHVSIKIGSNTSIYSCVSFGRMHTVIPN